jgi:hypothetical protein
MGELSERSGAPAPATAARRRWRVVRRVVLVALAGITALALVGG